MKFFLYVSTVGFIQNDIIAEQVRHVAIMDGRANPMRGAGCEYLFLNLRNFLFIQYFVLKFNIQKLRFSKCFMAKNAVIFFAGTRCVPDKKE